MVAWVGFRPTSPPVMSGGCSVLLSYSNGSLPDTSPVLLPLSHAEIWCGQNRHQSPSASSARRPASHPTPTGRADAFPPSTPYSLPINYLNELQPLTLQIEKRSKSFRKCLRLPGDEWFNRPVRQSLFLPLHPIPAGADDAPKMPDILRVHRVRPGPDG